MASSSQASLEGIWADRVQQRVTVLDNLETKCLSLHDAAILVGVSPRHLRRLRSTYQRLGRLGLVHGNVGRRPPNAVSAEIIDMVATLAQGPYRGQTQQALTRLLAEQYGLRLSRPTVHRILKRSRKDPAAARPDKGVGTEAELDNSFTEQSVGSQGSVLRRAHACG